MDLLRDIHQSGATICMVTHDPRYTNHAERTVHLFDGRIIEETKPTSLRSYAAEPRSPTC
jgi:putative ABC transport system ATP-binding protein